MNRICIHCSKTLDRNATYRKRFCDARCRVAYNRRKKQPKGYHEAMTGISLLGNALREDRKYSIDALRSLKKAIDLELEKLGDVETLEKMEMIRNRQVR